MKNNESDKNIASSNRKKILIGLLIVLSVFLIIHIIAVSNYGDDVNFRRGIDKYNIFQHMRRSYLAWSSRIVVNFFMFLALGVPLFVWKICDIVIICIIYIMFSKMTKNWLFSSLVLCSYPFIHMDSAGWVVTTTVYLWPFAAALGCFYLLYQANIERRKLNKIELVLYFVLFFYAANNEMILICFLLFFCSTHWGEVGIIKKAENRNMIAGTAVVCVINIINIVLCPGNAKRFARSVEKFMPEFPNLSIWDKFRICIVSTWQHFTSLPNVLFLLFSFVLMFAALKKSRTFWQKIVSVLPFVFSLGWSLYYFVFNIIIKRNINYILPEILPAWGTEGFLEQVIIVFSLMIYLVSVVISLYLIFEENNEWRFVCAEYIASLLSRFLLVFSPTMLASGTRIYFFFYMGMSIVLAKMMERDQNKKRRILYVICLTIGIAVNIAMVYAVQTIYSKNPV